MNELADSADARIESLTIRLERMSAALGEAGRLLSTGDGAAAALDLIQKTITADTKGFLSTLDEHTVRINLGGMHIRLPDSHDGGVVPLILEPAHEREPNVWTTSDGSGLYLAREWAEAADRMRTEAYREESKARAAAGNFAGAKVVEDYDGWVTSSGDEDDYAADVAELLEKHRDRLAWKGVSADDIPSQLPSWAYCCTEEGFDFDIEEAIHSYLDDNHHEDSVDWIKDWDGLYTFWNAWCAKQHNLRSYMIDYSRIVVIDRERYELELAAAKAILEKTK
jgi:hypothetical protein